MEFRVDGIIKFHLANKYKLKETLNFCSPSGARVALSSTEDNDLSVQITLEAENVEDAKGIAEIELDRIANLLSYSREVPIKGSRTKGVAYERLDAEGEPIMTMEGVVRLHAEVSTVMEFGAKSAEQLGRLLEKEYLPDFHDVISMYRQAISIEEQALKYILLYRLMEFLFKNDTKALTDWIKKKEPSVTMHPPDKYRNYHYTHYTYLRDNIHAKTKVFPHTQIINVLPQFQDLVKRAIKEKFEGSYP